jgi:uncharacterized protein (TIGR02598 family)
VKIRNSKETAFSLVEVTLALGVAAFCLIAVFGLMPAGVQANRNATSQTAAANIMAAVVSDLRATPKANNTSAQFGITFGSNTTLYFNSNGQASTSLGTNSRYRFTVTWGGSTGLRYADVKVSWPAAVDPASGTPNGLVENFAAFDRN